MKKEYYAYAQENLDIATQRYLKAFERFTRDTARADRLEADTKATSACNVLFGFDSTSVIAELRNDKHIKEALKDIAVYWRHARITKTQRALLGNDAMVQIKAIYKTL